MGGLTLSAKCSLWFALILCLIPMCLPGSVSALEPVSVSGEPLVIFRNSKGWTGGDGAYTALTPSGSVLWFFGDTFVGSISGGKRKDCSMIHNSCAVQESGTMAGRDLPRFYFPEKGGKPCDLIVPGKENGYFWPGAAVKVKNKVALFLKRVDVDESKAAPFNFSWKDDRLAVLANPDSEPARWKWRLVAVPGSNEDLHSGTAAMRSGDWVYIYGLRSKKAILGRVKESNIARGDTSAIQYFCKSGENERWVEGIEEATPVFDDAASEMSVFSLNRFSRAGFMALYTRGGFGPEIVVRESPAPWGPWSDARVIFSAPVDKNQFCYGAKAHPEFVSGDGTIPVTYHVNCGSLEEHVENPDVYFPRMVRIKIGAQSGKD